MAQTPLVVIEKVEIHHHNHIDTTEIVLKLDRIYRAVKSDTAAEAALASQNEELRKELEELLNGENLPPVIVEKVKAMVAKLKQGNEDLQKAISETTPKE